MERRSDSAESQLSGAQAAPVCEAGVSQVRASLDLEACNMLLTLLREWLSPLLKDTPKGKPRRHYRVICPTCKRQTRLSRSIRNQPIREIIYEMCWLCTPSTKWNAHYASRK